MFFRVLVRWFVEVFQSVVGFCLQVLIASR
uniref:Uncharacterized protein n=1 Tax=Arundo donax TaxID=35708 RepID=A0A0A9BXL7_ARUDO